MLREIIVCILLSACIQLNAQHSFGVKAGGGLSLLNTLSAEVYAYNEQKVRPQFSYQGGLFYSYLISDKVLLGAEANYLTIRGKEMIDVYIDNIGPGGFEMCDTIWRNISAVGLPFYFGINTGESNFNFGLQVNYYLSSGAIYRGTRYHSSGPPTYVADVYDGLNIDAFDVGARFGFLYLIGAKLHLEVNYYHGLNNLHYAHNTSNDPYRWKAFQLTIGLRYSIVGHTTYML